MSYNYSRFGKEPVLERTICMNCLTIWSAFYPAGHSDIRTECLKCGKMEGKALPDKLEDQLVLVLSKFCGETGANEGALDTLIRKVREVQP